MATVTGYTAARMQTIEDETVVDGNIVGDDLILVTRGGPTINAGNVRGPVGPTGPAVTALNDVGDVDAASPSDNQVLGFDLGSGMWVPVDILTNAPVDWHLPQTDQSQHFLYQGSDAFAVFGMTDDEQVGITVGGWRNGVGNWTPSALAPLYGMGLYLDPIGSIFAFHGQLAGSISGPTPDLFLTIALDSASGGASLSSVGDLILSSLTNKFELKGDPTGAPLVDFYNNATKLAALGFNDAASAMLIEAFNTQPIVIASNAFSVMDLHTRATVEGPYFRFLKDDVLKGSIGFNEDNELIVRNEVAAAVTFDLGGTHEVKISNNGRLELASHINFMGNDDFGLFGPGNEKFYWDDGESAWAWNVDFLGSRWLMYEIAFTPPDTDTAFMGSSTKRFNSMYAINYLTSSDGNLKDVVGPSDPDLILGLNPVEFTWNHIDDDRIHQGLIAQEVEEYLGPEAGLVDHPDIEGAPMSLQYTELIAPLIATVQRQEERIRELEARVL